MSADLFERTLAFHCAPSLTGLKPADLISWPEEPAVTRGRLKLMSRRLGCAPVRLRLLGRRGGRCLILVYRPAALAGQLAREEVRALLDREGYPTGEGLEAMLGGLAARLANPEGFPHEVGLFLGYPAGDVEGFRLHGGRDSLCGGMWQVYSDADRARRRFARYRRCQRELYGRVRGGCGLGTLLRAEGARTCGE